MVDDWLQSAQKALTWIPEFSIGHSKARLYFAVFAVAMTLSSVIYYKRIAAASKDH